MKERSTGVRDKGYPVVEATLYIYCDACGSFNIKTYVPFVKLIIVAIVLIVALFLTLNYNQWLICLLPLGWLALLLPWKDILLKYKCRKCGNTQITDFNSLKYRSYDMSVVDVSDKLTQKRYIDTDVLHFQQFT